jgi:hypothetical protein
VANFASFGKVSNFTAADGDALEVGELLALRWASGVELLRCFADRSVFSSHAWRRELAWEPKDSLEHGRELALEPISVDASLHKSSEHFA